MFKHLLVPLDGSNLAETALPYAAVLAQDLDAQVTLVHIIEENAPAEIHGERHLHTEDEACQYLDDIKQQHFTDSVEVSCHVHTEKTRHVARAIAEHVSELKPDMIVMSTHGKSGLRRLMVGNIAQQIIGRSQAPLFLVHPPDEQQQAAPQPPRLKRFLVALDGNPEHDQAGLPVAAHIAEAAGASLLLFSVVYTLQTLPPKLSATGKMLPSATAATLDSSVNAMQGYLAEQAQPWQDRGIPVTIEVTRGEPAQQILSAIDRNDCDLSILATHGKAGMSAFWAGSIAAPVITGSSKPLILVPVKS